MFEYGKRDPRFNPVTSQARQSLTSMTQLAKTAEKIISQFDDYSMFDLFIACQFHTRKITIIFNCSPAMAEFVQRKLGSPVTTDDGTVDYLFINVS